MPIQPASSSTADVQRHAHNMQTSSARSPGPPSCSTVLTVTEVLTHGAVYVNDVEGAALEHQADLSAPVCRSDMAGTGHKSRRAHGLAAGRRYRHGRGTGSSSGSTLRMPCALHGTHLGGTHAAAHLSPPPSAHDREPRPSPWSGAAPVEPGSAGREGGRLLQRQTMPQYLVRGIDFAGPCHAG